MAILGGNEMAIYTVDQSQRKAAKVVGAMYLFGFVAVFDELYVRGRLIITTMLWKQLGISSRTKDYFASASPSI